MSWTRRQAFLAFGAAGVAGCSTAVHQMMDADVIVLGAGISGLYAARALYAEGVNVRVIEADTRVGGRLHTLDAIEGRPEAGGVQVGKSYRRFRQAAADVGVAIVPAPPSLRRERTLVIDGTVLPSSEWATSSLNPFPDDMKGLAPDQVLFAVSARNNPLAEPGAWRSAAADNDISADAFLRNAGMDEASRALCNIALNANRLDTYSMINVWRSLSLYQREVALGPSDVVMGGSARVPEALANRLPSGAVELGSTIRAIEEELDFVRVTTDRGTYRAPHVICTLPFSALRRIALDVPVNLETSQAIKALPYTQVQQVHLAVDDLPADGLPLSMWTDTPIERVFPQIDDQGEVTGVKVWINGEGVLRGASDDTLFALAQRTLEQTRRLKTRPLAVTRWTDDQPFSGGAYMHWAPGTITRWAGKMGAPTERVSFAGEHLSRSHTGMEGALEAADDSVAWARAKLGA
ncbi:MAG: NAD(P)/FAD-dependent oxidoreductase [Pseudomonadota bacterium]